MAAVAVETKKGGVFEIWNFLLKIVANFNQFLGIVLDMHI